MTPITAAGAAGHPDPITITLLIIGIAAGYAVSLYFWPHRNCPRCRGARVTHGGGSLRPRFKACRRCSSTGRTRRIGATAVHRFYWSVLGERAQDRRRARIERLRASYQDLIADTRATSDPRQAPDDLRSQHPEPPGL